MAKRSDQFQTIRTEGALLPSDILQAIASRDVEGVSPDAYHLPPGTKINEAIAHAWSVLQKHWKGFQEARESLADDATGTEITNRHWLLPLFEELKYGRLTTVKSPEIDGRTYPVERFYADQPIHLIGCNLPLDRRTERARGAATASPHSMMQEFLNRHENSLWGFLSNGRQLRILRDNVSLSRQAFVEFDLEAMMEGELYGDFGLLWLLCHQSRIEAEKPSDFPLETWSQLAREQGTRVLADLRNGVARAIEALGRGFIAHPRNDRLREKLHSGQLDTQEYYRQLLRIVYRLLFLFVAEDRKLLHPPDADPDACERYDAFYSTARLRDLADNIRGSKHADLWHTLSLVFDALGHDDGCPELGLPALGSFLWRRSSTSDLPGPYQLPSPSPSVGEGRGEGASLEEPVLITNDDLLAAIRALAYIVQEKVRRAVDYRNLGSEELGSVYESLLELHPIMNVPARTFELSIAAGHERKTTGSYYTPDSLVQCLLDSALEPVVADRLEGKKGEQAEQALLDIKVCDPAAGSGHFLIAAAHRLARHLARIRTGETEPSPDDHQTALRDVIGRCIYGVDINPMAVELCKVSLWMEAIDPGRPLSFLDHHIQCGNSLLGTTPRLLAAGIPDDAFKAIEGDDKAVVRELKKQNKQERKDRAKGQNYLFEPYIKLGNLLGEFMRLSRGHDESVADVTEKERRYAELVSGSDYKNARLLADTWCAVFVWKKEKTELGKLCPTEHDLRNIENNPHDISPQVKAEVRRLADQYQLFHWHLALPDVFHITKESETPENDEAGWNGGFDVLLGNPPWERVKLQEKEWFGERVPKIGRTSNASTRKKLIASLEYDDPELFADYKNAVRVAEGVSHLLRDTGRFPLCGRGDVNTYAVFSELNRTSINKNGYFGCIVPAGLATDSTTQHFFKSLVDTSTLTSFYSFENTKEIFRGVDRNQTFALLTVGGSAHPNPEPRFATGLQGVDELAELDRIVTIAPAELMMLNPNTSTATFFRTSRDSKLLVHIYSRTPILHRDGPPAVNPWNANLWSMFHMTNDSGLFVEKENLGRCFDSQQDIPVTDSGKYLRLYEGKMINHYDHRFADAAAPATGQRIRASSEKISAAEHANSSRFAVPRYWVGQQDCLEKSACTSEIGFRDVAGSVANVRTVVGAVLPPCAAGNKVPMILLPDSGSRMKCCLLGCWNSFALDYVARQKITGLSLNFYLVKQFPILPPSDFQFPCRWRGKSSNCDWISTRVLELTYTAWDLEAFALECGYDGPPFRWEEERRFLLRCELDAAYFHLYLGPPAEWGTDSPQLREMFPTPRDAVDYIMETFPIVKRKDIARTEVKDDDGKVTQPGSYITKQTILEIYDAMQQAIDTGTPYQTRLDPPPGPPVDNDGNFLPMADWDKTDWPLHIHPSRNADS